MLMKFQTGGKIIENAAHYIRSVILRVRFNLGRNLCRFNKLTI